jgi:tight adherence protein C
MVARIVPRDWLTSVSVRERLALAGYDSEDAVTVFVASRLVLLVVLPFLALATFGLRSMTSAMVALLGAAAAAWVIPAGVVDGRIRRRQEKIRRAIPDSLDLMLVCVEAGISLESAILRVAREMVTVNPELALELANALRRIKAGTPRPDAFRSLYTRTGVEELRTLASNIVQSERWGTSITRVLRVTSDTLRRKRRQRAERLAQTAPIKMTIPLVLLILPALFITVLGPSVLLIMSVLTTSP